MKKITVLLLMLMLLLAACGKTPEQPAVTTVPTTASTTVTEPQPATQPSTEPSTEPSTASTEPDLFRSEACATLFGTWKTTVTIDKELLNTSYFTKKVEFDLYYIFNEDGTFDIHVDGMAFATAITKFEGLMVEHMVERRYATFKAEMERDGYSASRIDAMWTESEGAKVRTESEEFMAGLDLTGRFSQLLRQGKYYVMEGRVYTALPEGGWESSSFKVKSGKLTLSDTDNREIYRMLCVEFPLVLEKM